MKQYDLDALGMRLDRICVYMSEMSCLMRILYDLINNGGCNVLETDLATFSNIVNKHVKRLQRDISAFEKDFEFPISRKSCKLL